MAKENIICIDDEREVLAALKKDLEALENEYTISECETAAEAAGLIEELLNDGESIKLIICDHIMPGENGVEFLTRLYADQRFRNVKKVMLTGLATHQETIQAINEAHIDLYLEKPWDAEDLLAKVRVLL
ncbi:MAG: response regulator [Calditrichaeota bacterium]|nr:MAG: response regulator [Calditrichota bacterium]